MSDGTRPQNIPRCIEPRKFASHEVSLQGPVPVKDLTRLTEACIDVSNVGAELSFAVEDRERVVKGQVAAALQVQCQRCLEAAELNLTCDVNLAIVWSEESAREIPDGYDPWIVEEDEADLYGMIEDEILLNMPYIVYHDYACVDAKLLGLGPTEEPPSKDTHNPFQVLEQLKDKPKK